MGNLRLLLSPPFELYGWRGNRNLHGNKRAFLKEQKGGKEWHGTGRFVVGSKSSSDPFRSREIIFLTCKTYFYYILVKMFST